MNSYSNSKLFEGLCFYNTLSTRSTHHYSPASGNDFGCVFIKYNSSIDGNRPVFRPFGLLFDSVNPHPDLVSFSDGTEFGGVIFPNLFLDYRITLSIDTDQSFTVTIQFKDGLGTAPFVFQDTATSLPQNFHIEFNNVDRSQPAPRINETYYDNIKVWDGIVDPTPID